MNTKYIFPFLACLLAVNLFAQNEVARPVKINMAELTKRLHSAPGIFEKNKAKDAPSIELPLPDGSSKTFRMFKTQPMHPDLAAKFPDIQSYHGKCFEDGVSTIALTISPAELQAMLLDD